MTTDSASSTPVIHGALSETHAYEEPYTEPVVAHLPQQAPTVEEASAPVQEAEREPLENITEGAADTDQQLTVATKDGDASAQNAERDKEIVEEFEYLLEKSQQLFSGLSDLPEIGSKYWMPHFQRTFEVYTKLWKFQTQHRVLLEKAEHYGLKRWEVGEIASKIGQLYYRYYLRTSETNYLQEAYMFYDAIRERNYFKGEQEVKNSALMIKKLRYYARFIVVCLQMNNAPMMLQLLEEFKALIDIYSTTFNPVDKMEWSLVVKQMAMFMQAVCSPVPSNHSGMASLPVSYRLVARRRPRLEKDGSKFRLQEAVIVGNRPTQIKFSELTLDMYYMLQMLEREPSTKEAITGSSTTPAIPAPIETAEGSAARIADGSTADTPEAPDTATDIGGSGALVGKGKAVVRDKAEPSERDRDIVERERPSRRANPHKYVLYQPNFSQIQVYLANAFREISEQGCVLLYLSSEGVGTEAPSTANSAAAHGYIGGIATARRSSGEAAKDRSAEQLINTAHPADLVPYTRKPFFLVVESESSSAYKDMPNLFNQPLLCLLSPTQYPITSNSGSIYTFFLHSPIVAFCVVSQITSMAAEQWSELETLFIEFEDLTFELLNTYVAASSQVRKFLGDDFLRQIIIRHILCCVLLDLHLEFVRPEHMPQSSPERFKDVVTAPVLLRKARDIIELCSVEDRYRMSDRSPTPPPAKSLSPTQELPPASPQPIASEVIAGENGANDHSASPST
ncbi:hypothetical protein H4S07_000266 [Coemansia furcata]|uniref:Uncharacterized protein n=1 Tax=Coemansia furcata TaxID=417177 RepID=A0ACC1LSM7_9FUNG|nr:hypothetical protein H4S07_000266 [Coemansia furcata]